MFSIRTIERDNQKKIECKMIMAKDVKGWREGYNAAVQSGNIWMKMSIERYNDVKTYFFANFVAMPGSFDDIDEYEDFSDELKRLFLPHGETKLMECKFEYDIIKSPKNCQKKSIKKKRFRKIPIKTVAQELLEMAREIFFSQLTGRLGTALDLITKELKVTYPPNEDTQQEAKKEELPKEVVNFYENPLEKTRECNYCCNENTSNVKSDEENSDIE
ncbi:uncharacterized protein LOC111078106 [Drosophila obscura]|uniref:uncharacterized protein LOC111078106 n=1 Tax=Drosophila obscura TaxID=7282 RepID=UPI001BB1879F|nr:uncharacterized protein LOC111078106 [Drosophila obscura]XP_022228328.2 uncharacterized protein LOC111078106 [Drosophila obscura]